MRSEGLVFQDSGSGPENKTDPCKTGALSMDEALPSYASSRWSPARVNSQTLQPQMPKLVIDPYKESLNDRFREPLTTQAP